jgi:hypothetical protein
MPHRLRACWRAIATRRVNAHHARLVLAGRARVVGSRAGASEGVAQSAGQCAGRAKGRVCVLGSWHNHSFKVVGTFIYTTGVVWPTLYALVQPFNTQH